jgi:hypothetical protein
MTFVLLSAGCSDGDAGTQPTPSTSGGQSVAETTTPSPTDTVQPPVMPAAAKKADIAGAEAFLKYYWSTVDYAFVTGDVDELKKLGRPECDACSTTVANIEGVYSSGKAITGGASNLREIVVRPGNAEAGLSVRAIFSQDAFVIHEGDSTDEASASEEFLMLTIVRWSGSSWQVAEWGKDDGK